MPWLAEWLVGKPATIALIGAVFAGAFFVRQATAGASTHARALLIAAAGWLLYAAWEWLVLVRTPDADMRVDLLVIWPVMAIVSIWALFRAFR